MLVNQLWLSITLCYYVSEQGGVESEPESKLESKLKSGTQLDTCQVRSEKYAFLDTLTP